MIALMLALAAPATPAETAPYMVRIVCPDRKDADGETGTGVRIDETHAITAYHVVRDGSCLVDGREVRVVDSRPDIDFAVIELKERGVAWRWGFDCSRWTRGETYHMGGYFGSSLHFVQASASSIYTKPGSFVTGALLTTGRQLEIGMSGGPAYVSSGAVGALNEGYFQDDTHTSLIRLLADTPICEKGSPWYRGA